MVLRVCVSALVASLLLAGCKKEESKPAVAATTAPVVEKKPEAAKEPAKAEVEFAGEWKKGEVTAAKVVFVAQLEPCLPVPEKPTRLGEEVMKNEGSLFAEFFIPQGTVGHACLYGVDEAGKVIAAAAYPRNPVTFQGQGEVTVGPMQLELKKL